MKDDTISAILQDTRIPNTVKGVCLKEYIKTYGKAELRGKHFIDDDNVHSILLANHDVYCRLIQQVKVDIYNTIASDRETMKLRD